MKIPYFFEKPIVVIPLCVASLFVLNMSAEWLDSPYWPTLVLMFFSENIPFISGYVKNSSFPENTRIYMTFTFMLLPAHFWYTYKELSTNKTAPWFKKLWFMHSYWELIKRIGLTSLIVALIYFSIFVNPGYDFNLLPLNSSRVSLALGGWLIAGGVQGQLIAWVFCNFLVVIRFFREK